MEERQFMSQDLANCAAFLAAQAAHQHRELRQMNSRNASSAAKREVHVACNDDEYGAYAIQSDSPQ